MSDFAAARVFVAGHEGLLGRALVRALAREGHEGVIVARREVLDLEAPDAVARFFDRERPDYVFLAAGRVGGIRENLRAPADLIRANLAIQSAVLSAAQRSGVRGLMAFGSSCMYPRECAQPMGEAALFSGPLEPTSRPYAVAKLAAVEQCRAYRAQYGLRFFTAVPSTLYGPYDHFAGEAGHVIPQLLARFAQAEQSGAREVAVLGTGRARRDFIHCDDAAEGALFLMRLEAELDVVNVAPGASVAISELAETIADVVGFEGDIVYDTSAPEGAPAKCLANDQIRSLGWTPEIGLRAGIERTYDWFREGKSSPTYS